MHFFFARVRKTRMKNTAESNLFQKAKGEKEKEEIAGSSAELCSIIVSLRTVQRFAKSFLSFSPAEYNKVTCYVALIVINSRRNRGRSVARWLGNVINTGSPGVARR